MGEHAVHGSPWGPWLGLALLGAYHGINPAMGWLFAVALGMQERSGRRVLAALVPIGLGHGLSVALVLALMWGARWVLPAAVMRYGVAVLLVGYGLLHLWRAHHPRWAGMRVGFRDLVAWSFLMATAHGAGLMLAPLLWWGGPAGAGGGSSGRLPGPPGPEHGAAHLHHLGAAGGAAGHAGHAGSSPGFLDGLPALLGATAVHAGSMLLVAGIVALLVYRRLGLHLLRQAWINLDWVWALALVASGVAVALTG